MRSRVDISAVERSSNFHELMDQINKTGFSRIPVYRENIDRIEGLLYIKKTCYPFFMKRRKFPLATVLAACLFIPDKKIDALFKDFQQKQVHMAIGDEYGGTEGLITMEDIIEEIVGEINDEFDEALDADYKKIDNDTFIFEGKTSLNDFCKIMSEEADVFDDIKGESESLGGFGDLEINRKLPLFQRED